MLMPKSLLFRLRQWRPHNAWYSSVSPFFFRHPGLRVYHYIVLFRQDQAVPRRHAFNTCNTLEACLQHILLNVLWRGRTWLELNTVFKGLLIWLNIHICYACDLPIRIKWSQWTNLLFRCHFSFYSGQCLGSGSPLNLLPWTRTRLLNPNLVPYI